MSLTITPEILLHAYRAGIFPMADDANSTELFWYDPPERTIFPLAHFHLSHRLRRTVRHTLRCGHFRLSLNHDFTATMRACAAPNPARSREKTWINEEIIALYTALHQQNHAHSIEAWHNGQMVGGLYGVQVGGAFFGESMFSTMADASKICLVALVALLRAHQFQLLDCQFMTPHLQQFGAVTISRADYHNRLAKACAALPYPNLTQWMSGNWVAEGGAAGSAIGGTYPGTATGNPSAAGLVGATASTDLFAGEPLLASVITGFLQEITHTS